MERQIDPDVQQVGILHGRFCHHCVNVTSVVKHFERSVDWKSAASPYSLKWLIKSNK